MKNHNIYSGLLLLISLLFSQISFSQSPDFLSSGELVKSEVYFWIESDSVKHTPVLVPELAKFGDQLFQFCSENPNKKVSINLKWSMSNPFVVKDISNILAKVVNGLSLKLQSSVLSPILLSGLKLKVGNKKISLDKVSGSANDYNSLVEGYCGRLKGMFFKLTSSQAQDEVSISGKDFNNKSFNIIYPVNALSQGVSGNIHAYQPSGDNSEVLNCRNGSYSKPYTFVFSKITRSHNCRVGYNHTFAPKQGYLLYPKGNFSNVHLATRKIVTNDKKKGHRNATLKISKSSDNRTFTIKKSAVLSVQISGDADNNKGRKRDCGVEHASISAVQIPTFCIEYMD